MTLNRLIKALKRHQKRHGKKPVYFVDDYDRATKIGTIWIALPDSWDGTPKDTTFPCIGV